MDPRYQVKKWCTYVLDVSVKYDKVFQICQDIFRLDNRYKFIMENFFSQLCLYKFCYLGHSVKFFNIHNFDWRKAQMQIA